MSQREMFEIRCSDCGKTENVSFYPVKGRPVYCRACFSKYRAGGLKSVWTDVRPDPKQAWIQQEEGWQRRKKREPTNQFHLH